MDTNKEDSKLGDKGNKGLKPTTRVFKPKQPAASLTQSTYESLT